VKTIADLKRALSDYPETTPVVVFSSEFDGMDLWNGQVELRTTDKYYRYNGLDDGTPYLFVGQ